MTVLQSEGLITMLASVLKKEEADFTAEDFKLIKDIALSTVGFNRKFTAVFLEDLQQFPELENLSLSKIIIDDEGWEIICRCRHLCRLSLYECELENLNGIDCLRELERLELIRTPVTDFKPLEKLPLRKLRLIGADLPDLRFIDKLAHLGSLRIICSHIGNRKLPVHLEHFHTLDFSGTDFDDYPRLKTAKILKRLYLSEQQINELKPLLLELRRQLPDLQIFDQYQNKQA